MPSIRLRLSCVLVAAVVYVVSVASPIVAQSGYSVSQQKNPGQLTVTYSGTMTRQYAMGPFQSISQMLAPDDFLYASRWQNPITFPNLPAVTPAKPFVFPFFGVNYSSITVTSKGFIYMGSYGYSDIDNLDSTAQFAPDYSTSGTGFPSIDGVSRPVISFLHSSGGAVSMSSLANSGLPAGCLAGTGACQLNNYLYEIMPPISSYTSVTKGASGQTATLVTLTPVNSIGTPADGYRFVLLGVQLRDVTGVAASVIVILYQSGLIEIYYYTISPGTVQSQGDYTTGTPTTPTGGDGYVSVGIQGLIGSKPTWYTFNPPSVSQVSYLSLQGTLAGSAISFKPS